jgi:hypothetical protein
MDRRRRAALQNGRDSSPKVIEEPSSLRVGWEGNGVRTAGTDLAEKRRFSQPRRILDIFVPSLSWNGHLGVR